MPTEDAIFRALADPSRRAIFVRLANGEAPVRDLTAHFKISQPAVSQHLAALKRAGMVLERKEGRMVHYRVKKDAMRPLVDWIALYQAFWPERVDRLKALLDRMD